MSEQLERPDEEDSAERYVGRAVTRPDAPPKVRGDAEYVMDLEPGGLLHAALVTSQVPHAKLVDVDTSPATSMPEVEAVATAADVPDEMRGQFILDQPILPSEKVRYVGEPIAVVAAETAEAAERAANEVEVEYEPLDPVFDLEAAFERDPPGVVHENVREYEFATQGDPRYESRGHVDDHDADRPNLLYKDTHESGDVDAAFEAADHVVEGTYEVKPIQHCAMEPHVAIADVRYDETTIWTSQQVPHNIEAEVCMVYPDLSPTDLTIKTEYVGGGFGGKITPFLETMVLAVARKVSRPVRLQLSRSQEFTSGVSRPQAITKIRDGVTDDGELLARDVDILFNCGAYNEQVFRCTCSGPSATVGAYDVPNVRWNSHAVYTNRPMYAAFRGFGKPEVNWGIERHMNRVAAELDIDPLEYRAKNLLREGDTNAKGETLGPNDTERCLRGPPAELADVSVAEEFPEYDGDEWAIGRGFAYGSKPVSRAAASVTVKVQRDMEIEVHAGAPDIGQGSDTMLTQIAAESFDVPMENVTLVTGDTDRTPYDRGPTGSRFTYHTGNALRRAAAEAKSKLFSLAADHFDEPVDSATLRTEDGTVSAAGVADSVHVNELFSDYGQQTGVSNTMLARGGELIGTATYDSRRGGEDHAFWTPVGQAALVAVNTLTGKTDVLQFNTTCDVGRAINPKNVEQQLEGASGQGIATALYEEIVYDGGRVVNPNFKDYRVPGATELPYRSTTTVLESIDDDGPFGGKGVGEMGMMASAPAVAHAVEDAIGVSFETIPVTPERIIAALEERAGED
jgi:CO/xanthine dehydrogenase Mo-binding subunit